MCQKDKDVNNRSYYNKVYYDKVYHNKVYYNDLSKRTCTGEYFDLMDNLIKYCEDDYVPMHMPGSKRNADLVSIKNPYEIDITEIDGFDNMHNAQGIIKNAFSRCAKLFGAEETLFLINGSSSGILSAICGCTCKNERVLVARNCHCSVYNALYLNELNPVYIYPEVNEYGINGSITVDMIKEKIDEFTDIKCVVITSPTYEGIVSNIKGIADLLHEKGIVLIVDEAHGAHLKFSSEFPDSSVTCGADVVIQSIHKTLPSLTQTALMHINGSLVDREKIKKYWNIFQTTSPSYILMSSIDRCTSILEKNAEMLFDKYIRRLKKLRSRISKLKNIKLFPVDDISKIVLIVLDGKYLYNELLNKYHIQLEMASVSYVIAMTSIADTDEYYDRFLFALEELDKNEMLKFNNIENEKKECRENNNLYNVNKSEEAFVVMNLYEANNCKETQLVRIDDSEGRISAASVCFYPPGINLVNPGEKINRQIIDKINSGISKGLEVIGLEMYPTDQISHITKVKDKTEVNIKSEINKNIKEVYIRCVK